MTKISSLLLALCVTTVWADGSENAAAQTLTAGIAIARVYLGSGLQNATGTENATAVADFGVWHAPQYMPGFPTAATIWPRVVEVRCSGQVCAGYTINSDMGRGEYLFFRPVSAQ